ncbi:NUDIX hydrolase [Sporosarcina cyprini]|uniref:NUDIX hydrolase n=1 Tax=Sporosarcina cyprini TaxID=2910523 RepID=UPI001EE0F8AA|nr:NUDIX hydrolase [Sporosarcina cyprini]MCG3087483.1 NUDIX hydrolase [Sporosarcina cyprini]
MGYVQEIRQLVGTRPIILVGANVIVIDQLGRMLLQLRSDNNCWGLPGGTMEPGETLEEVAKRELLEEKNLTAIELIPFNFYSGKEFYYRYPHGDEVYNVVATYICRQYHGLLQGNSDEVLDVQFFYPNELPVNCSPPDLPMIQDYFRLFSVGEGEL